MLSPKSFIHPLMRFSVSLLAAHFIVVQGSLEPITFLMTKSYYYYSLFLSLIIAQLITEYIYWISKKLNFRHQGALLHNERLTEQFIVGFLISSVFAFLLAAGLYSWHGENIFESNYFGKLYALVMLYIFAVNAFYVLYLYRLHLARLKPKTMTEEEAAQPAVIFAQNKAYFAIDFHGRQSVWEHSIEHTLTILDNRDYFHVNRGTIIHRKAILAIRRFEIRCLKIIPVMPCPIDLHTSRRSTIAFKKWILDQ